MFNKDGSLGGTSEYQTNPYGLLNRHGYRKDESRLLNVTEEIYEVVALQTRCHPSNVERNIRTVVLCAWHTNRPLLVKMAGFTLTAPPRASQFIDIIASYIQREVLSDPSRRVLI